MSRQRIEAKVRKNWCFQEATRLLDRHGLAWKLYPPTGKGHPYLLIDNPNGGEPIRMHMATTPKSRGTGRATLSGLRHKLIRAGVLKNHYKAD